MGSRARAREASAHSTLFHQLGFASCRATLPLTADSNPGLPGQPGWIYFEPNPDNPASSANSPNLQLGPVNYPVSAPAVLVDLTSGSLPLPRLRPQGNVIMVPAYTDLKLHDMSATSDRRRIPNASRSTRISRLVSQLFCGELQIHYAQTVGLLQPGWRLHAPREIHHRP
jgi:hypothetical protein